MHTERNHSSGLLLAREQYAALYTLRSGVAMSRRCACSKEPEVMNLAPRQKICSILASYPNGPWIEAKQPRLSVTFRFRWGNPVDSADHNICFKSYASNDADVQNLDSCLQPTFRPPDRDPVTLLHLCRF